MSENTLSDAADAEEQASAADGEEGVEDAGGSEEQASDAAPSESEDDSADDGEDQQPKQKPSRQKRRRSNWQDTRARLEGRLMAAERHNDALLKRIEELKAPNRDDIDDPDEYTARSASVHAERGVTQAQIEANRQEIDAARKELSQTAVRELYDAGSDLHDDFADVIGSARLITDNMAQALTDMDPEDGAAVAYHVAKSPKLQRELSELSPTKLAIRYGRLAAELSQPPPKKTTSAPNSSKTSVAGRGVRGPKKPEEMTYQEYEQARMKGDIR